MESRIGHLERKSSRLCCLLTTVIVVLLCAFFFALGMCVSRCCATKGGNCGAGLPKGAILVNCGPGGMNGGPSDCGMGGGPGGRLMGGGPGQAAIIEIELDGAMDQEAMRRIHGEVMRQMGGGEGDETPDT